MQTLNTRTHSGRRTVKLLRGTPLVPFSRCRKCMSETRDQSYSCTRMLNCGNCRTNRKHTAVRRTHRTPPRR